MRTKGYAVLKFALRKAVINIYGLLRINKIINDCLYFLERKLLLRSDLV